MELLAFLMIFPLVVAAVLLLVRSNGARKVIVGGSAAIIAVASLVLVGMYLGAGRVEFEFSSSALSILCTVVDVALSLLVLGYAVRLKPG